MGVGARHVEWLVWAADGGAEGSGLARHEWVEWAALRHCWQ